LKNKGFPIYKNAHKHGDLYLTLEAEMPMNLSKKEKELFEELKTIRS
jgi:curved DNA-binding protein